MKILSELRIVDGINPALRLNDYTSMQLIERRVAAVLLITLTSDRSIEPVAAEYLERLHVLAAVKLNARLRRRHTQDGQISCLWARIPRPIDNVSVIIACAVVTTVSHCFVDL